MEIFINDLGTLKFRNSSGVGQYTLNGSTWKNFKNPTGTKSITANGNGIDVTDYASVNVAVPSTVYWGASVVGAAAFAANAASYLEYGLNSTYQYALTVFMCPTKNLDGGWQGVMSVTNANGTCNEVVSPYNASASDTWIQYGAWHISGCTYIKINVPVKLSTPYLVFVTLLALS